MKGKHLEVEGSARLVVCCASPIAGVMALDRATHAFCSPKRRRVCLQEVKAFAEPMSGATQARIAALKSATTPAWTPPFATPAAPALPSLASHRAGKPWFPRLFGPCAFALIPPPVTDPGPETPHLQPVTG